MEKLLFFFRRLVDIALAVFLLESFDSAGCIDELLLAGVERMAHRANVCADILDRTAGLESISAAAFYFNGIVFWMYVFFHFLSP